MSDKPRHSEQVQIFPLRDREELHALIERLKLACEEVTQAGFDAIMITLHPMSDVRSVQLEGERDETPEETKDRLAWEQETEQLNRESRKEILVANLQMYTRKEILEALDVAHRNA